MTSFRKVLERGVLSKMEVLSFSVNGQEGGFSEMHDFLHVQAMVKCEKMARKDESIDNKPSKITWKQEVSSVWRRFRPLELTKRRVEKYAKTQVRIWALRVCVYVFCCCCC